MYMTQEAKLLWAGEPKNYTGAASTDKYVSMKNYGHLTILILTGAWAAGTAAVTLEQAKEVAGTNHQDLAFTKYYHDEAESGTLVETACVDTFNLDTANKLYVIEVDAEDLDTNDDFDCVTVQIASPGANADFYGVIYVLSDPRYAQATPPSALVD